MHQVVLRRYRKLLEHGGPFPDLILIDGGKGQLAAAYQALEELGLSNLVAVGIAKKEETAVYARPRGRHRAAEGQPGAAADPADPRRGASVRGHLPPPVAHEARPPVRARRIAGVGPRRRKALLTAFGSLAGVRRATREDLARVVGAKCADAVLGSLRRRVSVD